jgi:hypothetical protein
VALLRKPTHTLSAEELRAFTQELRTLATSPQALGKKLREGKENKPKTVKAASGKTLDDFITELEGET